MEVGAGTFHPATTLRALAKALNAPMAALAPAQGRALRREPEPAAALLQYQVILKPNPPNLQELYLTAGGNRRRSAAA
jgi:glycyl-tRNA synthetase alpha chain